MSCTRQFSSANEARDAALLVVQRRHPLFKGQRLVTRNRTRLCKDSEELWVPQHGGRVHEPLQRGPIHCFALAPSCNALTIRHGERNGCVIRTKADHAMSKHQTKMPLGPVQLRRHFKDPSAAAAARLTPESVGSAVGSVRCMPLHINALVPSKHSALRKITRHDKLGIRK
ncbi:hypothetical protein TraAM80_09763 [Trypanosoma rangeli]|uniref:Uncharacterized protein n=1 Tax=Trypanosoma rangeli TaxID=5698 RepID=A0A3R7JWB5_TRYRA|nr:uncharacterized protein TraAM80_09763 [Trypanosoma rangeli]RNE96497.1 hypothetical protein TraAM80_09763 [Trypanosoma rangeli]|eukprot:RNE96497.1 hypothetical protein TraAM80_09763 [Trypanosoma rangeli]